MSHVLVEDILLMLDEFGLARCGDLSRVHFRFPHDGTLRRVLTDLTQDASTAVDLASKRRHVLSDWQGLLRRSEYDGNENFRVGTRGGDCIILRFRSFLTRQAEYNLGFCMDDSKQSEFRHLSPLAKYIATHLKSVMETRHVGW